LLPRINREIGLARMVRKYAFRVRFPLYGRRGPGRNILDSYLDHLHTRHAAGYKNSMPLWRELQDCGLPGTLEQVRRWLSERRMRPARTTTQRFETLSPNQDSGCPKLCARRRPVWRSRVSGSRAVRDLQLQNPFGRSNQETANRITPPFSINLTSVILSGMSSTPARFKLPYSTAPSRPAMVTSAVSLAYNQLQKHDPIGMGAWAHGG
jgi:hypothetical protein